MSAERKENKKLREEWQFNSVHWEVAIKQLSELFARNKEDFNRTKIITT